MMSDCRQPHGSNATTLIAIRLPPKLTWRDLGLQVCRYGLCRPRKNTGRWAAGRGKHLSNNRLMHVQKGIPISKPQQIQNNKRSLFRSNNLRADCTSLWRKEAEPYF